MLQIVRSFDIPKKIVSAIGLLYNKLRVPFWLVTVSLNHLMSTLMYFKATIYNPSYL